MLDMLNVADLVESIVNDSKLVNNDKTRFEDIYINIGWFIYVVIYCVYYTFFIILYFYTFMFG